MRNVYATIRRQVGRANEKLFIKNKYLRTATWLVALAVSAILVGFGYAFATSPATIRGPQFEHLHYRMQLIVNDKPVHFGEKKFQEGYSKDNCNAELTRSPIHFHDNKDQFVHIHWKHMTGGQVLKYYGWNYIGGADGLLGYRFDGFPNLQTVPIHGKLLPSVPKDANFYVYSGDEQGYTERRFEDFKNQDLETFFDQQSALTPDATGFLDRLFPKAVAHDGHEHGTDGTSEETLKRINNLIGNVVIFVQKDRPADDQVQAQFEALEPLSESSCAG